MDPVVSAFDDHQRRALALTGELIGSLSAGDRPSGVRRRARALLGPHGFTTWLRPPRVGFDGRLEPGTAVTLVLQPATRLAFGAVACTLVPLGGEPESVAEAIALARETCRAVCGYASPTKCTGELLVYARAWAVNHRARLMSRRAIGFRCLPPRGPLSVGYPRSARLVARLQRHRVHLLNPALLAGVWSLQPEVGVGGISARFGELIAVDEGGRRVLGRGGLDEVGTFPTR